MKPIRKVRLDESPLAWPKGGLAPCICNAGIIKQFGIPLGIPLVNLESTLHYMKKEIKAVHKYPNPIREWKLVLEINGNNRNLVEPCPTGHNISKPIKRKRGWVRSMFKPKSLDQLSQ